MPQPIRMTTGLSFRSSPRMILGRPKIAALVGAITVEWGAIDNLLATIFNFASFAKPIPVNALSESELAAVIFDTLVALPARLEVIQRVVDVRCEKEVRENFVNLAKLIRKRAQERNHAVHAHWQMCDDFPDDLIAEGKDGQLLKYTERDFEDILDRVVAVRLKLADFSILIAYAPKKAID